MTKAKETKVQAKQVTVTDEQVKAFLAAQKKNTGNGVAEVARQVVAEGIESFTKTGQLPTRKQQIEEIMKRVPDATPNSAASARHQARKHYGLVSSKA